jgi:hypothetical protein
MRRSTPIRDGGAGVAIVYAVELMGLLDELFPFGLDGDGLVRAFTSLVHMPPAMTSRI